MKLWAQYFHIGTEGKPIEMCGSDGVYVCDGRKTYENAKTDAINHALTRNKHVRSEITHVQMMRGSRFTDSVKAGVLTCIMKGVTL